MGRNHIGSSAPESVLRTMWKSGELEKHMLQTNENLPLEIIIPGETNTDSGPDFRNAVVRIGGVIFRGDIEVHRRNKEWLEHKHHHDPAYNSVVLHVVWHDDMPAVFPATQSGRIIPVLILSNVPDPDLPVSPRVDAAQLCQAASPSGLSCLHLTAGFSDAAGAWMCKLGMKRIEVKVRRFDDRLRELIEERRRNLREPYHRYGSTGVNADELPPPKMGYSTYEAREKILWEQLLYEGCLEALGYSKNQEPFLRLACILPLSSVREICSDVSEAEKQVYIKSLLFGCARLLPVPKNGMDRQSKNELRRLRSIYRKIRRIHPHETIPKSAWRFFRLRPENFPTLRLAGGSYLCSAIVAQNIFRETIRCIKEEGIPVNKKFRILSSFFLVDADGFWSCHYRFGECSRRPVRMLVGWDRAKEIVINVVLPLALLYARIFKDRHVRESCIAMLEEEVTLPLNSVVRRITGTLFRDEKIIRSVQFYQGILQLNKLYCREGRCTECEIEKIRQHND